MKPKKYIVWSKNEIDLDDPWQRKWYIQQVLAYGRAEDVTQLDWEEIKATLKDLYLPSAVKRLWERYFSDKK